ncbi:tetratricopeptide repeat protein [Fimbriiglobus ruber]|uniref:TPR domain protein, putative component of TonB system n=1 Tax=Fimbriiglobus ruber TaxID=1908690 RepID=A0A225E961_9BACT|nr:tetratricopeptide repeat protein [Fimbriiglobus ruber]OWK44967.1 TPR domain protein, putative component of TonB system [Fimbriiglobus ruber]
MSARLLGLAAAGAALVGAGCLGKTAGLTDPSKSPPPEPAKSDVRSSAKISAKEAGALDLNMAESLEAAGKDADAIAYYEKARRADPAVADRAGRRLAILYDKTDDQSRALAEFQELLRKHPKDTDLLSDVGYSYYNRGQWATAEEYLKRAVEADKTNKRAWGNLGMTLAMQGRYDESVGAFAKSTTPAGVHANLAFVLTTQKKFEAAAREYREALNLDPTLKIAQAGLARLEASSPVPPKDDAGGVLPAAGATDPAGVR